MTKEKIELGAVQPPEVVGKKKRGPGRPPKTKTQRVRDMLEAGSSVKHISEKLGVSPQQVYQVRYTDKKKELVSITQKQWADDRIPCTPTEAKLIKAKLMRPTPAPKPTFWQRVKAVFLPN